MLVLNAADTLDGVSTHASEVTYTVTGAEVATASGQPTFKTLAQGQLAAAAAAIYTVPSATMAQVSSILLSNNNTVAETVSLYVKGTAAANRIVQLSLPANGSATFGRDGWRVYDANGNLLTGPGLSFTNAIDTGASQTSGSLSTLALTSGTGAQVDTSHDRTLAVPVTFNASGAAAATCQVELSPDGTTYSTLATESLPATSLTGIVRMLTVRVPARWYVRLTATNATLATGTYY